MFDSDPEWNECDTNTCQAPEGATGITSCVYCGGELIEVDGLWYHWSSFDNQGNLLKGAQVQDYVRNKTTITKHKTMKTGIELITRERQEQIEKHHRSINEDVVCNSEFQLQHAIMLLISNLGFQYSGIQMPKEAFEDLKPDRWDSEICFKMMAKSDIEQLQIIGAFAAAEIDRLQAIKQQSNEQPK